MPEAPLGDQPQICACPGCDEIVVQRDSGSTRLYHSDECRRKARRLRHVGKAAETADLPTAAAAPGPPVADLAPAAEPAAAESPAAAAPADAELAAPAGLAAAELATAELPANAELPGSAAGQDAVSSPDDHGGPDAAEQPGDSEFWKPRNDGFWDPDKDTARAGARSPGQHRLPAGQRSRLKRSHAVAIALTLAASAVGLGLIFSQPGTRHPLASGAQLQIPGPAQTHSPSSAPSTPTPSGRTSHAPGHAAGGTGAAPRTRATSPSSPSAPHSPAPSRTAAPPAPTPTRSATTAPKPPPSRKPTRQVPAGLISFENGNDGWTTLWGSISASRTTHVAYSGSHALQITTTSTYSAVGVDNSSVAHLQSGDEVTYHIYSNGEGGMVEPFAEASGDPEDVAESVPLPSQPGWFTLTWTIPSVSNVWTIGMQVTNHGGGQLTLAMDALTWTGS
jgi:hypothetical protein